MIDLSKTQLFAFDFDGTLVQSNDIKRSVYFEVSSHIPNADVILEELLETRHELDRHGIFDVLAKRIKGIDPRSTARAYSEQCETRILTCPEIPGTTALLTRLAEMGHVAIVNSATPEVHLRKIVPQLSFGSLIHAIYGEPIGKAENLQNAMRRFGVQSDQTLMIGDRESDRLGALGAGCQFIGVLSDLTDFRSTPEIIVERLDDLIIWL